MPAMNFLQRFFVNRSARRRAARRYEWIRRGSVVPAGAVCLEIGCGTGELAARFVAGFRPARYVATDLDPRQLEEASRALRKRFPDGIPPELELKEADMLQLPFPDTSFDVTLAFVALHHAGATHHDFTKVPQALSEIDRVLRPNGVLLYSELMHKEPIRGWLAAHGYAIGEVERRWRIESVVARKSGKKG